MNTYPKTCPGCGQTFDENENMTGPEHLNASAGCHNRYTELISLQYHRYSHPLVQKLTHAAYCANHSSDTSRKGLETAWLSLLTLHLFHVMKNDADTLNHNLRIIQSDPPPFDRLDKPVYELSIRPEKIMQTESLEKHLELVEEYSAQTWAGWQKHHDTLAGRIRRFKGLFK